MLVLHPHGPSLLSVAFAMDVFIGLPTEVQYVDETTSGLLKIFKVQGGHDRPRPKV